MMNNNNINKLNEILDNMELSLSDINSAKDNLPNHESNSSSNEYMNQSESYLEDAIDEMKTLIKLIDGSGNNNKIYESPDGGKTVYEREFNNYWIRKKI